MGSAQSKTAARDRRQKTRQSKKRQPIKSEVHSNGPIKEEHSQNGPIKTKHRSNGDKSRNSKEPIKVQDSENQPIREKSASKESILTVEIATNTGSKDQEQSQTTKDSKNAKNRKNGEAAKEKPGRKNEKSKSKDDTTENRKSKPKRLSHQKQKEQIEKEKKQQRVTKEQLRSLASSLRRTSWYLGKKIGMDESQIKRYDVGFATEEERKYQMLLWWRRVRGWKATEQQLVILLELGNYTEEEYSAILTSSNGDVTIYEKAPDIAQEEDTTKDNTIREPYHSDVIKPHSRSYGNMCYDDALEAQLYEKTKQDEKQKKTREVKRETKNDDERKKEHQKHRSGHRSKDTNENSLPPWWKKPGDTLERPRPRRTKEAKHTEIPKKTSTEKEPATEKEEMQEFQQMHDGTQSSASHTDDSGIVTSPHMSQKQIENDKSEPKASEENDRTPTKPDENTITKTTESAPTEPKRSSKKLIVRRCSDSVVKLRYSSLMEEKPRTAKPVEPAIKEYESGEELEQIFSQNNASHNDVTNDNSDVTRTHNGDKKEIHHDSTNKDSDVTRTRTGTLRKKRRDVTESTDDITKSQHDNVARSQPLEVSRSYDDITDDDDVTNSNCDLTKQGYQSDIRGMVKKYESLSKLHEAQNRESMALSIQRHWENTNSSLPREFSQQSHRASRTSQSSTGSRSTTLSKTSASCHGHRSSTYMQRYHFFSFGGKGKFPSRFKGLISGLAILGNGNVVASDGDNKRIQIFDKRGRFLTTFDTNTELKPKGVCVTPDERIAVCCGDTVNVYDRDGHLHLSFGQGVFRNNSYCVCCDPKGNYYVTDIVSHTISIHDARGRIRKRFGFLGTSMIHFNQPVSLVINKKNQLFITDSQNHCIKVYTLSGRPVSRIGAKGSSDGLFWNPLGICLDDNDHLYVADCGNNRISEFDSDGIFMRQVLTESDGIWMPSLIQVNKLGQLVICEWEKQLIKVFTIETSV